MAPKDNLTTYILKQGRNKKKTFALKDFRKQSAEYFKQQACPSLPLPLPLPPFPSPFPLPLLTGLSARRQALQLRPVRVREQEG